jgi:ribokinase
MPPDPNALAKVLPRVDILVPNRTELGQLSGLNEPDTITDVAACLTALRFEGPVVVTLGADGAAVFERGELRQFSAVHVEPIDTTGAGDAFCGALAAGLAAGLSVDDSVREAVKVAGRSTTLRGAQLTAESVEGPAGEALS